MGKKVLVIEDSRLTCHILEIELRQKDFDVIVAHDGKEGLLKAQTIAADIILLDLVLPDIPGEEVCRKLRKDSRTENIPIIMLTGKDTEVDRVIGKVLGAQGYIAKPFDIDQLLTEINKWIVVMLLVFCICASVSMLVA